LIGAVASLVEEEKQSEQREHRAAERGYWSHQEMINKYTLVISGLALLGAIVTTVISLLALRSAIESTNQARRQADIEFSAQRPWLRVKLIFGSLKFEAGGANITFGVKLKNVGKSPARNLQQRFTIRTATKAFAINTIVEQRRQCDLASQDSGFAESEKGIPGIIVFPNEEAPDNVIGGNGWASSPVSNTTFDQAWPEAGKPYFQIIGCYDYELPSGEHGDTGFAYLLQKSNGNEFPSGFLPSVGMIHEDQVIFKPDPFATGYFK